MSVRSECPCRISSYVITRPEIERDTTVQRRELRRMGDVVPTSDDDEVEFVHHGMLLVQLCDSCLLVMFRDQGTIKFAGAYAV